MTPAERARSAGRPLPARFWAAGLSFCRAAAARDAAPYCGRLRHLFFGEEAYQLARLWTAGYDVFAFGVPVAFHQWERGARAATYQRDHRPAAAAGGAAGGSGGGAAGGDVDGGAREGGGGHDGGGKGASARAACAADAAAAAAERAASQAVVRAVLSGAAPPPEAAAALGAAAEDFAPGGAWGLGRARALAGLEAHCGVSFAQRRPLAAAGETGGGGGGGGGGSGSGGERDAGG